jgi:trehalose 6-phosphate phosphatase
VSVAAQLEPLLAHPDRCAVMSDIDGTLAPIVDDPAAARVPEDTARLLARLADRYALVACISGRRALQGRRMVGVPGITYVGNHGYERLDPGEETPWADPAAAPRARRTVEFVDALDWSRLDRLGIRREDKGPIQVLHWRGAPDGAEAETAAREIAAQARGRDLIPHRARKALEIRPVAGIDKGSAAHRLLVEAAPLEAALFVGDDLTDIDAFRAMRALAGSSRLGKALCVGVDSPESPPDLGSESTFLVDGPEGVVEVLEVLAG